MLKNNDDFDVLVDALKKREEILKNKQSIRKYNKYFEIMRKCAHNLINHNRQAELLPYLDSESVSIQRDVAGLLFNSYPDRCREVLQKISEMTVDNGLPECFLNVSVSASMSLEIGIPKDFP